MAITILLVEDHALIRRGIATMLKTWIGLWIVGEAGTSLEAVNLAAKHKPDVVILDIGLPDMDGVTVVKAIRTLETPPSILCLSAFSERRYVFAILQAGAIGYLSKDCQPTELAAAIDAVSEGHRYLNPELANIFLAGMKSHDSNQPASQLSEREAEIVALLTNGLAMKKVAKELGIKTKTVEMHRRAVMEKLGIRSTAELTKYAIREG